MNDADLKNRILRLQLQREFAVHLRRNIKDGAGIIALAPGDHLLDVIAGFADKAGNLLNDFRLIAVQDHHACRRFQSA